MLNWNSYNDKIDNQNKIIDLTNHIEGVLSKEPQKTLSPFNIHKREKLQQSPYERATTSPVNGEELKFYNREKNMSQECRSRSVTRNAAAVTHVQSNKHIDSILIGNRS